MKDWKDDNLRLMLIEMLEGDQKYRKRTDSIRRVFGEDSKKMDELWRKQDRIDSVNSIQLSRIIEGLNTYPGKTIVGKACQDYALIIIQHSTLDFQEKFLPLIREAARKKEVNVSAVMLLEDRIHQRKTGKQIFGTQMYWDKEQLMMQQVPIDTTIDLSIFNKHLGLTKDNEFFIK